MATPVAVAERELREYLDVAVAAARHAGEVIRRGFNAPKDVQHKGKVDLVTETDKQCEALIMQHISAAYPSHKFIGEEESSERGTAGLGDDPTWMVDPLDGTTNFVHRYPFVCVSIGLAINKAVVVGVVFNPILNEMFTAMRGHGAMLNDEPIHASSQADMGSALLATEIGTKRDAGTVAGLTGRISNLLFQVRSLRLSGSCALNLVGVACGRLDLFYEIGFGGPWDVAAGSLIVEEAGGLCFDPSGGPFDVMACRVAASNGHLKAAFVEALACDAVANGQT